MEVITFPEAGIKGKEQPVYANEDHRLKYSIARRKMSVTVFESECIVPP